MALIKCPECGKEVSDKALQCIHCGYPLNNTNENVANIPESPVKYKVLLVDYGETKMSVIRVVKEITNLGLAEAKELVDNCPSYIVGDITNEEYEQISRTFSRVGAKVQREEMRENDVINSFVNSQQSKPFTANQNQTNNQKQGLGFWGVVGAIIVAVLIMMFL